MWFLPVEESTALRMRRRLTNRERPQTIIGLAELAAPIDREPLPH
jgi:hypothetical protein